MFLEDLGTATKLCDAYSKYKYLYEVDKKGDSKDDVVYRCKSALDSVCLLCYDLPGATVSIKSVYLRDQRDTSARLEYSEDSSIWQTIDLTDADSIAQKVYDGVLKILKQIEYKLELLYNIRLLNNMMVLLANTYEITYDITFFCGKGIKNLTDNSISIGLSERVVCTLEQLLYRGGLMPVAAAFSGYAQTFKNLPNIIECMRRKTWFTKNLGFYTRRNARTIIRGSYHSDYRNISNGVGYIETPEYFTLIRVNSVSAEELEFLKDEYKDKLYYSENNEPKSRDCFIAKSEVELEKYKARLDKKNRSYKVMQFGTDEEPVYKIVYNQYNICAFIYGPVNLQTYAKPHGVINSQIFDY